MKERPIFTDRQLKVIRERCEGFIPEPIYQEVIEVCRIIDRWLEKEKKNGE